MKLIPIPMLQVRRAAYIMGDTSAAAGALREYQRRSDQGEDVRLFQDVRSRAIVVGPSHPPAIPNRSSKDG